MADFFCPFIPQTYLRIDGLKEPGPCLDRPPLLCHSSHSVAVCGHSSLAERLDKEEDRATSSPRVWPEERLQNLALQCFNSIKLRWKLFITRNLQLLSVCRTNQPDTPESRSLACPLPLPQNDDPGITNGNTRECQVKQIVALSAAFSDLALG